MTNDPLPDQPTASPLPPRAARRSPTITFACQWCDHTLAVDAAAAGRRVRCGQCRRVMRVPAAAATTAMTAGPLLEVAPEPSPAGRPRWPRRVRAIQPQRVWAGIERDGWVALAIGLPLAVVVLTVPCIGLVVNTLQMILHESGHTAAAWLLATPAVPQFDLHYGSAFTHKMHRQPLLILAAYVGIGYLAYLARGNRRALVGWAVAAVAYGVAVTNPVRGLLISTMGHGGELVFAALFLYRALSGSQILTPVERPLYAMLGFYGIIYNVRFAAQLIFAESARAAYGDAMGGGHRMDFDRVAATLHCPLQAVAAVFGIACLLTPAAAYLAHRYRRFSGPAAA